MPFIKKYNIELICQECGKKFYQYPSKLHHTKFCCKKCKDKNTKRKFKLKYSRVPKKRVTITCHNLLCRKKFIVWPYMKNQKYCCHKCYLITKTTEYLEILETIKIKMDRNKRMDIWKINKI